tara:strand:+ start:242 stop:445 length:204 start_codon:yes stop_codon:yes gene_type:complete
LKDIRSYIYVRNFYNIINISSTFDGGSIYIFKGLKMVSIKISYLLFFLTVCIFVIWGILKYFGVGDD